MSHCFCGSVIPFLRINDSAVVIEKVIQKVNENSLALNIISVNNNLLTAHVSSGNQIYPSLKSKFTINSIRLALRNE